MTLSAKRRIPDPISATMSLTKNKKSEYPTKDPWGTADITSRGFDDIFVYNNLLLCKLQKFFDAIDYLLTDEKFVQFVD